jgi:hypothetical protein
MGGEVIQIVEIWLHMKTDFEVLFVETAYIQTQVPALL